MRGLVQIIRSPEGTAHFQVPNRFDTHTSELAQLPNALDHAGSGIVHFCLRRKSAQAETNRRLRQFVTQTQGLQHIRRIDVVGGACRPAGNCNSVESGQQVSPCTPAKLTFRLPGSR